MTATPQQQQEDYSSLFWEVVRGLNNNNNNIIKALKDEEGKVQREIAAEERHCERLRQRRASYTSNNNSDNNNNNSIVTTPAMQKLQYKLKLLQALERCREDLLRENHRQPLAHHYTFGMVGHVALSTRARLCIRDAMGSSKKEKNAPMGLIAGPGEGKSLFLDEMAEEVERRGKRMARNNINKSNNNNDNDEVPVVLAVSLADLEMTDPRFLTSIDASAITYTGNRPTSTTTTVITTTTTTISGSGGAVRREEEREDININNNNNDDRDASPMPSGPVVYMSAAVAAQEVWRRVFPALDTAAVLPSCMTGAEAAEVLSILIPKRQVVLLVDELTRAMEFLPLQPSEPIDVIDGGYVDKKEETISPLLLSEEEKRQPHIQRKLFGHNIWSFCQSHTTLLYTGNDASLRDSLVGKDGPTCRILCFDPLRPVSGEEGESLISRRATTSSITTGTTDCDYAHHLYPLKTLLLHTYMQAPTTRFRLLPTYYEMAKSTPGLIGAMVDYLQQPVWITLVSASTDSTSAATRDRLTEMAKEAISSYDPILSGSMPLVSKLLEAPANAVLQGNDAPTAADPRGHTITTFPLHKIVSLLVQYVYFCAARCRFPTSMNTFGKRLVACRIGHTFDFDGVYVPPLVAYLVLRRVSASGALTMDAPEHMVIPNNNNDEPMSPGTFEDACEALTFLSNRQNKVFVGAILYSVEVLNKWVTKRLHAANVVAQCDVDAHYFKLFVLSCLTCRAMGIVAALTERERDRHVGYSSCYGSPEPAYRSGTTTAEPSRARNDNTNSRPGSVSMGRRNPSAVRDSVDINYYSKDSRRASVANIATAGIAAVEAAAAVPIGQTIEKLTPVAEYFSHCDYPHCPMVAEDEAKLQAHRCTYGGVVPPPGSICAHSAPLLTRTAATKAGLTESNTNMSAGVATTSDGINGTKQKVVVIKETAEQENKYNNKNKDGKLYTQPPIDIVYRVSATEEYWVWCRPPHLQQDDNNISSPASALRQRPPRGSFTPLLRNAAACGIKKVVYVVFGPTGPISTNMLGCALLPDEEEEESNTGVKLLSRYIVMGTEEAELFLTPIVAAMAPHMYDVDPTIIEEDDNNNNNYNNNNARRSSISSNQAYRVSSSHRSSSVNKDKDVNGGNYRSSSVRSTSNGIVDVDDYGKERRPQQWEKPFLVPQYSPDWIAIRTDENFLQSLEDEDRDEAEIVAEHCRMAIGDAKEKPDQYHISSKELEIVEPPIDNDRAVVAPKKQKSGCCSVM